jgi:hypothetical protein
MTNRKGYSLCLIILLYLFGWGSICIIELRTIIRSGRFAIFRLRPFARDFEERMAVQSRSGLILSRIWTSFILVHWCVMRKAQQRVHM